MVKSGSQSFWLCKVTAQKGTADFPDRETIDFPGGKLRRTKLSNPFQSRRPAILSGNALNPGIFSIRY